MPAEKENNKPVDSFEAFRGMRDAYLDAMSKVMIKAVNSDEYAEASGALLNGTLTLTAPFRQALDKSMVMALQQLSLPSREEIDVLAQRFSNMEMRLDDMDAKLDRLVDLASSVQPAIAKTDQEVKRPAPAAAKAAHQASTRKG
ncbi:MAG: poly(R)-hydroxyalkanoic acid synthase subunit PhaE [Terracidiphilus sp.]